ncbi:hypothetical protein GCM10009813_07830 [Brevibacterium marinum]
MLTGGTTMLSWPDSLCRRVAGGGRRVVRYDLRDSGESSTGDPEDPTYNLRDLADDASKLICALGSETAHLGGVGVGGMAAQVAALDHPEVVSALTLVSTRPVAPGPVDDDLPDHDQSAMSAVLSRPQPDWTDRRAVAQYAAEGATTLGNDPEQARATAARIWDRTPTPETSVHQANQLGKVFSRIDCSPRWRERLGDLRIPSLVIHGRADPFFPVGNGEVLAAEIPDAQLLIQEGMGTQMPERATEDIATAMLRL